MFNLSGWMIPILTQFAPMFYGIGTWHKVEVLVFGTILATGQRTVSAILQVMALGQVEN
jgi:hypothetical protein